jgi:hypothetical protein
MFGSEILDVAIGLALVYLLLSLICSAIREIAEGWFKTRAAFLEKGLCELLRDRSGGAAGDRPLVQDLYEHPLIAGLYNGTYASPAAMRLPGITLSAVAGKTNLPAYIPAGHFAAALLDMAARGRTVAGSPAARAVTVASIRESVHELGHPYVERAILAALDTAGDDLAQAQRNVAAWYDGAMDRVSGWYKRRTQAWLFALGFGSAVAMNVNTVVVARHLYRDENARAVVVAAAGRTTGDTTVLRDSLDALTVRLARLDLPIGWRHGFKHGLVGSATAAAGLTEPAWDARALTGAFVVALFGWVMTALAVSLGGPFWFDLLNKMMVIRSTVKPREKSPDEGSEDRQARSASPVRVTVAAGDGQPRLAAGTAPLPAGGAAAPNALQPGTPPPRGTMLPL